MPVENQIKKVLFDQLRLLAVVVGEEVLPERIKFYVEKIYPELEGMSLGEIKNRIDLAAEEFKFFPKYPEFKKHMVGAPTDTDEAQFIVHTIFEAARRIGWQRAGAAQEFIGPIGWMVVEAMGGWTAICEMPISEHGRARAQMRDLAKSFQSVGHMAPRSIKSMPASNAKARLEDLTQALASAERSLKLVNEASNEN